MSQSRIAIAAVTLLVLGIGSAAAGGIYRWVDDQGRVHYGDRPPADGKGVGNLPGPASPTPDSGAAERRQRRQRLLDTFATERQERQAQAARDRSQRAELRRRCTLAHNRLTDFERANLLYRQGKDGQRQYLSDADRAAAIAGLREGIARNCKGG